MQHWLEWVITRPVEALQKRIETVGSGNFAPDRTVEWNNELGDIGRGINQLAENVDSLMTRRVEDERRKQELEYRMLQNEVNPHLSTTPSTASAGWLPSSTRPALPRWSPPLHG
mgnify:CR=1 FL=1